MGSKPKIVKEARYETVTRREYTSHYQTVYTKGVYMHYFVPGIIIAKEEMYWLLEDKPQRLPICTPPMEFPEIETIKPIEKFKKSFSSIRYAVDLGNQFFITEIKKMWLKNAEMKMLK